MAISFALLFVFSLSISAQDRTEEVLKYNNGKTSRIAHYINDTVLDGHWVSYFMNENKFEEGDYSNGEKVGEWFNYFESGDTLSQINYENGVYRMWFYSGQKQVVGQVKDGEKEGLWTEYIEIYYGYVKSQGNYSQGLKNGVWLSHNESNELLLPTMKIYKSL